MKNRLEDLLPLAGVVSFVVFSTVIISYLRTDYAVMNLGKTFMAMFFLTFGGLKAYNLEGFKEAFKSYDILAQKSDLYATAYPFLELGLGIAYGSMLYVNSLNFEIVTHLAAIVLMTVSGIGVFQALYDGKDLRCACLGNVFKVPMTWVTLFEDFGMALMALAMLLLII